MGPRTEYAPGTFSWVDLATTDVAAAKAFYTDLFGWTTEDDPGGTPYTLCRVGDAIACGIAAQPDDARAAGAPPTWTSYVTVEDADAAVARASSLGGSTVADAFDVADYGRVAVFADPQGAEFAVWQPGTRIGAERVNDIGCLCMNELTTDDIAAARTFYEGLFGWTSEQVDTGPDGPEMVAVTNGKTLNASISRTEGDEPPHWRPYFTVESTASALERVQDLGGRTVLGPVPIPDGSIAIALDPQGAELAFFEGPVDP